MANTLFLLSLATIWFMLLYHMFLMQGGYFHFLRYRKPIQQWIQAMRSYPTVSVLIPCHNEEVVIENTLKAMVRLKYPKEKLEIIVINDSSTDRTLELAEAFAQTHPFIKVVTTEEEFAAKGKSTALNFGLQHSIGEIIVVYDADNTPESDAVYHLVLALKNDPKAGAVVGKFRVSNARKNLLTRFINIETICFQWLVQAGRWLWFKMATIPGTNFAIRRSLLEKLNGWDHRALAEDTELTIRVYEQGYHIRFFPEAITWEQEPESWKVWWKQRLRWARGNQYVILKFFRKLFTIKRKGIFFDIFYFFFTYFLFFFGVILSNILFILNIFIDLDLQAGIISFLLWMLAYFLFITEVLIALSIEKSEINLQNFFVVLIMYFTYSQIWILLVMYAIFLETKRMLLKEEMQWYKTERFTKQKHM